MMKKRDIHGRCKWIEEMRVKVIHYRPLSMSKYLYYGFPEIENFVQFLISHENSRNEWNTFFNKNYRKEINRLQVIAFQVNNDNLLSENDQEDIQRILEQDSLSIIDKNIILLECISKPDHETIILLEKFLQKFFLNLDSMSELNDYILAAVMLPINLGWKLYQAKVYLINRKYEIYETE